MSQMYFSIAANWDLELLDRLKGTPVKSLYGQMWGDPLGGGRMSLFIPKVGKKEVASFIAEARKRKIGFNYLVNSTCLDNQEFSRKGYKKIREHLEWISSTGADMVTVTLPFLLQMVKKDFPNLKVCVSSFCRIQNTQLARYWEDLGADKIVLPERIGRDFQALRLIREAVDCELELIANHCCLFQCPLDLHHRNMVSHGSQDGHPCGGFAPDYCKVACQRIKLVDPTEIIKARWIRPEDVPEYEALGINCLKLIERFRGTESLMKITHAYEQRSYKGNLVELLSLPQKGAFLAPNLEVLQRTDLIEPEKMKEVMDVLKEPFPGKIDIDNEKLNGFLDFFKKIDCFHTDCKRCGYCERMTRKAVAIDEKWRKEMVARFDRALDILVSGEIAGFPQ
jgi:collagenase-like PrtC family protease